MRRVFTSSAALLVFAGLLALATLPFLGRGWLAAHQQQTLLLLSQLSKLKHSESAYLLLMAGFSLATITPVLPLSALAILAGSLFGFSLSVWLAVVIGIGLGAATSFLLARYGLRKHLLAWVGKRISLDRLDHSLSARGWRLVFLIRLSPIAPFSVVSYGFGLTKIGISDFLLGTAGTLPALTAYLYSGSLSQDFFSTLSGSVGLQRWVKASLLLLGFLCTILAALMVGRVAKTVFGDSAQCEPQTRVD